MARRPEVRFVVALVGLGLLGLLAAACRPSAAGGPSAGVPSPSARLPAPSTSVPSPSAALPSPAPPLRVAAAADLRYAMDELVAAWSATHPGQPVEAVYGSSGSFFAQIGQGAPFDLFFSADIEYPRRLVEAGLADGSTLRPYAVGQIVVWVRADSPLAVEARGLEVVLDPSVERVAIANPEHAPYGRAAIAALDHVGYTDRVRPKLVLGENVSQAAQFVESGNADVGIIALSLARAPILAGRGRFAIVPIDSYPRLEQGAVVLRAARDGAAARAFLDFVLGPDGRAVLDRYGFLLPR